jgi:short-subunit dehydrogenase
MSHRLDGKTAVITGAGSGIGRETALECARRGARLAICDIDATGLKQTAERATALGAEVLTGTVDVSDSDSMNAFAAQVHERFDDVDVLINNAGIGVFATFENTELADWKRLLDINVMGVVHGCRAFLPAMKARGDGHIVNVASQAGFQASPVLAAYSASKFAVFGFSEALRSELAPHGIGVTAVCPGVVNTAITRSSTVRGDRSAERQAKVVKLYERRNYGPEKVAPRILRAIRRNRAVAPITPEAHVAYALSRHAPPISRWVARKMAAVTE